VVVATDFTIQVFPHPSFAEGRLKHSDKIATYRKQDFLEESTQPKSEERPTEPLIPLNAAVSVSVTVVQIDLKDAIVFMIVLAIVLYLIIRFLRSPNGLPRIS
jgi:hypothetical protein